MSGLVEAALQMQAIIAAELAAQVEGGVDAALADVGVHLEPADAIRAAIARKVAQVLISPPTFTRGGVLEGGHVDVTWSVVVLTRKVPRVLDQWRRLDQVVRAIDRIDALDIARAAPGQITNPDGDALPAYVLTLDPTTV